MKIRIDQADKYFSLCVRERVGNRCEADGCQRTSQDYRIDCAHIFSRRHNSTRWNPGNAVSLCFLHHQNWTGDPLEFTAWVESRIGPQKLADLRLKAHLTLKVTKQDRAYIAQHYRAAHKAMLEKRKAGHTGYLQFEHWG